MPDFAQYDQVIADLLAQLATEQAEYLVAHGKYQQRHSTKTDGVTWEVHEYVCPDGSVGYVLLSRVLIGSVVYERRENVGPEDWRSSDWTERAEMQS